MWLKQSNRGENHTIKRRNKKTCNYKRKTKKIQEIMSGKICDISSPLLSIVSGFTPQLNNKNTA